MSLDEVLPCCGKLGSVYLGNLDSALDIQQLKSKKIKSVLTLGSNITIDYRKRIKAYEKKSVSSSCSSMSSDSNCSSSGGPFQVNSLVIDVDDQQYSDLSRHFHRTHAFLSQTRLQGNVLVHCMMGVSRSATVLIAYLMQHDGLSHQEAFQLVKSRRGCVQPNKGFTRQLNELEQSLSYPRKKEE